jgi:hypothetical protein
MIRNVKPPAKEYSEEGMYYDVNKVYASELVGSRMNKE